MKLDTFTETIDAGEGKGVIEISVEHNLIDPFGLSIEDAFESWFIRTDEYTTRSFCNYVRSKSPVFICNPIDK